MAIARILLLGVAVALLWSCQIVLADGRAVASLLSPTKKETSTNHGLTRKPVSRGQSEPTAMEKLNVETKKFFSATGRALTPKKSPPKQNPYTPWLKAPQKKPWWQTMFHREEPKVESMKDWVGLDRPD